MKLVTNWALNLISSSQIPNLSPESHRKVKKTLSLSHVRTHLVVDPAIRYRRRPVLCMEGRKE